MKSYLTNIRNEECTYVCFFQGYISEQAKFWQCYMYKPRYRYTALEKNNYWVILLETKSILSVAIQHIQIFEWAELVQIELHGCTWTGLVSQVMHPFHREFLDEAAFHFVLDKIRD